MGSTRFKFRNLLYCFLGGAVLAIAYTYCSQISNAASWVMLGIATLFVSATIILFSRLKFRIRLSYQKAAALLLGCSVFPQAVWSKGIHLCVSDILLVVVAIWLFAARKVVIPSVYLFLTTAYLSYALLSFLWADPWTDSIVPFVQLTEYLLVSVIVFYNVRQIADVYKLIKTYVFFASGVAIAAIILWLATHDSYRMLYLLRLQKNALGQIVGDALPLDLGLIFMASQRKEKRLWYYFAFLVNMFALILSMSRGATMGAAVGLLMVFVFSGALKRISVIYGVVIGGSVIWYLVNWYISRSYNYANYLFNLDPGSSAYTRVVMWNDVLQKIQQKPVFGHGLGTYFISIPMMGFQQQDPNNIFLLNLHDLGIVGLWLFSVVVLYILVAGLRSLKWKSISYERILHVCIFAGFVSQLVHWQVDVSWVRGTSLFFAAMIGLTLRMYKNQRTVRTREVSQTESTLALNAS
jgi:O-antigen ligase